MLRSFSRLVLAATLAAAVTAHAQDPKPRERDKPADAAELAGITARGRAIAEYDQTAWHATDAVQATHPAKDAVQMYIGKKTPEGWIVAFGKLNEAQDAFLLAYECKPTGDVLKPEVVVNTPAAEDRSDWLHIAKAFNLARTTLQVNRAYNGAVLEAPGGNWYVYFYPAQTDAKVFPTGGDYRYLISADGTKILDTHRMHLSILENNMEPPKDGKKQVASYHNAILDDAPEDTDVADVIMMGHMPMYVGTRHFIYSIRADGTATFLQNREKK